MTLSAPMRCSALAEQLGEPLAGTVDQRRRWLLLEDRSAWGTDAVADSFGADDSSWEKGDDNQLRGSGTLSMALREYKESADYAPSEPMRWRRRSASAFACSW